MAATLNATTTGKSGTFNETSDTVATITSVVRAAGEGLFVEYWHEYDYGSPSAVSSVVWDAAGDNQAMTNISTQSESGVNRILTVWYLAAPTSAKTADITVTHSGVVNSRWQAHVRHVVGHDTTTPVRSGSVSARSETAPETNDLPNTISSATDDLAIFVGSIRTDNTQVSAGDLSNYAESEFGGSRLLFSGTKAGATSVTGTAAYADAIAQTNALIAFSVQAAAGGGGDATAGAPTHKALLGMF